MYRWRKIVAYSSLLQSRQKENLASIKGLRLYALIIIEWQMYVRATQKEFNYNTTSYLMVLCLAICTTTSKLSLMIFC